MSDVQDNNNLIKGYLFIETQKHFANSKDTFDDTSEANGLRSYTANGWIKITHSIPRGEFIKIAANRDVVRIEAEFNRVKNKPNGNNGSYEIKGGQHAGSGSFINISVKSREEVGFQASDNAEFTHFFVCHAERNDSPFYLRWRIVLRDFANEATAGWRSCQ
jgi:hypothetical protein